MAKKSYKIPDTLDKGFGETEIPLQSSDGLGTKPIPIMIILIYICSALLWFYSVSRSFIRAGGIGLIVAFSILWLALTILLMKRDKTGIPEASLVVSMVNYLPKSMRYLITRKTAKANAFRALVGIKDINYDTGLITFLDDTYAFLYRVVGTGSVLLFEDDKTAILDRYDMFWRKIKADCEILFITSKEPQKIYRQLANAERRYVGLDVKDRELAAVAERNFNFLRDQVGMNFRSIHQYMLVKADNKEALMQTKNIILSEVENSSMVFKQCTPLFGSDIDDVLSTIFKGKETV